MVLKLQIISDVPKFIVMLSTQYRCFQVESDASQLAFTNSLPLGRDPRTRLYPFWYLTVMDKVNTVVYKSGNWLKKGRLANHVFWTFLNLWISFLHFLHFPNTSTSHFCKNRPERKWHLGAPFVILEFRNVFFIHGATDPRTDQSAVWYLVRRHESGNPWQG